MKKTFSVLLLFLLLFTLLPCQLGCGEKPGESPKNNYTTRSKTVSYQHFNTVTMISTYGTTTEEEFNAYVALTDELLGYYHKLFDIYYEYTGINNLKTVNDNAGIMPIKVEEELIDFLLYCKELYTLTEGKTNVMLGSVLSIWHDAREKADARGGMLDAKDLPDESALRAAAEHTSIDTLIINRADKTVYISDPLASIDVGAIAKGYAAAKLAERLRAMEADSMAINAGGNIITIGLKPDGSNWVTGITNPDKESDNPLICRVALGETALVTSGNYERYFVCNEKRYHHIIDPATLMPADHFASVSIFTADSGLADALSTALFCMSYEEGLDLVQRIGDVDVLWIYENGTMKMTEGVTITE